MLPAHFRLFSMIPLYRIGMICCRAPWPPLSGWAERRAKQAAPVAKAPGSPVAQGLRAARRCVRVALWLRARARGCQRGRIAAPAGQTLPGVERDALPAELETVATWRSRNDNDTSTL